MPSPSTSNFIRIWLYLSEHSARSYAMKKELEERKLGPTTIASILALEQQDLERLLLKEIIWMNN